MIPPLPPFSGPDLTIEDRRRLVNQLDILRSLMEDMEWRSLAEIEGATGFPQASISAQLRNLRKAPFGGNIIERRRRRVGKGTWEYRMLVL